MVVKCCHDTLAFGDEFDQDFAQATTCHGMKRFCLPHWHVTRKIFWAFVTVMSMTLLGSQLVDRFNNFMKFELKTEISINAEKSLPLPTVTICNLNLFTKSLLGPMDMQLLENVSFALSKQVNKHYWSKMSPGDDFVANWSSQKYWKMVEQFEELESKILSEHQESSFTVDKWILRTGWQLRLPGSNSTSLLSCRIGRKSCNYENFKQILTPQGICYSLNYKPPRFYQKMPGAESGISLILDIKQDEYTHFMLNGDSGQYECGGKVIINEWYDYVDLGMGIGVAPGFLGYVSTRKVRRTTINHPPWGRCEDRVTMRGEPYSARQCHSECTARHSIEACGCRLWYEPMLDNRPICGVARTTACLILKSLLTVEEEKIEEECIKSCVEACETISYSTTASYTLMATNNTIDAFIEYLKTMTGRIYSEAQVLRNIIAIQVAYPELLVEAMSSTPAQSLSSFLGDIGGQMGLFAGISLITFIELFEYPILKIASIFKRRRNNYQLSYPMSTAQMSILAANNRKMGTFEGDIDDDDRAAAMIVSNGTGLEIKAKTRNGAPAYFVGAHARIQIDDSGIRFSKTPTKSYALLEPVCPSKSN